MKTFCLWLQRLYILGFLLFAWHIAPFSRFASVFPIAWSLTVVVAAYVLPLRTASAKESGTLTLQGILVGTLIGLAIGAADWSLPDVTLLFALCWALMPLFLFDRFFASMWNKA